MMKNLFHGEFGLAEWELDMQDEPDLPEGMGMTHAEVDISADQHQELDAFLKEFEAASAAAPEMIEIRPGR